MQACSVSVQALLEPTVTNASFVAVGCRVVQGGCTDSYSSGYFLTISAAGTWNLSSGNNVLESGRGLRINDGSFHTLALSIDSNGSMRAAFDHTILAHNVIVDAFAAGWAAIGSSFDYIQFDNFKLDGTITTTPACGTGTNVKTFPCQNDVTQQWMVDPSRPNTTMSFVHQPDGALWCLNADTSTNTANVAPCNGLDPSQLWTFAPNTATYSPASNKAFCLDLTDASVSNCAPVGTWNCNYNINQNWEYVPSTGALVSPVDGYCLTVSR